MPDFYYIFTIIIIIIIKSKDWQVSCQGGELEIPFNVNENQIEVEQLVFDDTQKNFLSSCKYATNEDIIELYYKF